ncbi:hypothetical protein SGFS_097860 [Streptomyces graminofaciens]|uniref:OmpR/PhoB-type domain-containing protein n=1 Tax=Streptomyces graminofaciens TaxID=68212 RepID=A0ABM7FKT0_9ACTN|nr:winged helix-turn-helix domain-containing protein [Streptomyces graminofaciens]BBC38492.1 hypothetical protein SGFS_097860 [Streptomyces graminofaciens]
MVVTRERLSVSSGARPAPASPVLVVARTPDDAGLADLRRACRRFGWAAVEQIGEERLAWSASVRRPSAVVISAADAAWTEHAAAAVRGSTSRPLVVVGDLDSADVLALVRAGADAVLPTGLPDEELLSRTYAVMRRSTEQLGPGTRYLAAGPLRVDLWQRTVRRDNTEVHLTSTEFDLLALLMRNAEGTLAPGAILLRVWGRGGGPDGLNTLRICVGRLRAKLGDDARHSTMIASVRGYGYRFALPVLEIPDEDRVNLAAAGEQADHIDAIAEIAEQLAAPGDEHGLATALVEALLERGLADGAGVHQVDGDVLRLVAHRGLSEEWVSRVAPGVRPGDGYASVHAVQTAAPVQLTKLSARHHRGTYWLLQSEKPMSCLFVPIGRSGRIEGCLGILRRTSTPHGPAAIAVLRALCSVYAAESAARRAMREIEGARP